MNVLHTPANSGPNAAVRLIGIGTLGRHFVRRFHTHIHTHTHTHTHTDAPLHTPLADLLDQSPCVLEVDAGQAADAAVARVDLVGTRILCLAFGLDLTSVEIEAAMLLVWHLWAQEAHVIGVVVGAHQRPPPDRDSILGILCDSIDACVDISDPDDPVELAPLQWFYVGLQRSVLAGLSIMEPAWDHSDVVETLDFGQVRLELFTQPLDKPTQLDAAMVEILEELHHRGVWLEDALGAVLVLWAPSEYQLTVRMVRGLGRSLSEALGAGALHLTIRLRSRPTGEDQTAYLTLVVSTPRSRTHLQ